MSIQSNDALAGAGVGAKIGSVAGPIGTAAGAIIGGLSGVALAQNSMTGASKVALATALARAEAGIPKVDFLSGGNFKQKVALQHEQDAALQPRVQEIMKDPEFNRQPLTFGQVQSVGVRPSTRALLLANSPASAALYGGGGGTAGGGTTGGGLNLPAGGGGGSSGSTGGVNFDIPAGIGGTGASSMPTDPGMSGSNTDSSGLFGSGGSTIDTLLGAAGVIGSGAASQRQGALLNDALDAYNKSWTRGRGIATAQHPVDLSADFADPTNPFYRPSMGAVPTTDANGNPLRPSSPPTSLPGVPPLSTGLPPTAAPPTPFNGPPSAGALPPMTPPGLGGGLSPFASNAPPARAPGGLAAMIGAIRARQGGAGGGLPGIPPLNLGGPGGAARVPGTGLPSMNL